MMSTLGQFVTSKAEQLILESLLPGGKRWKTAVEKQGRDCLKSCPRYRSGTCYGPNKMCSGDWVEAEMSPKVLDTLFHILNNFDHYDVRDLPIHTRESTDFKALLERVHDEIKANASIAFFPEGAPVTVEHVRRERNSAAAKRVKNFALNGGSYPCPGCEVDYLKRYGRVGKALYQCHHLIPLSDKRHSGNTKDADLIVLCANCHQMIHTTELGLCLDELKKLHITTRVSREGQP